LRQARRIWAVPAIHGEAGRLAALLQLLAPRIEQDDRVVFSATIRYGRAIRATLDELLTFRRWLMAQPGMFAYDLASCAAAQEEMWQKLLQLQFAVNRAKVLAWMLDHGVGATVESYGGDLRQGEAAAREGPRAIARWTSASHPDGPACRPPGAAQQPAPCRLTDDMAVLFVHAGIDPARRSRPERRVMVGLSRLRPVEPPFHDFRLLVRELTQPMAGSKAPSTRSPWTPAAASAVRWLPRASIPRGECFPASKRS